MGDRRLKSNLGNIKSFFGGIGNLTPAEKCGIKVEGENKWVTLIQNAKKEMTS